MHARLLMQDRMHPSILMAECLCSLLSCCPVSCVAVSCVLASFPSHHHGPSSPWFFCFVLSLLFLVLSLRLGVVAVIVVNQKDNPAKCIVFSLFVHGALVHSWVHTLVHKNKNNNTKPLHPPALPLLTALRSSLCPPIPSPTPFPPHFVCSLSFLSFPFLSSQICAVRPFCS